MTPEQALQIILQAFVTRPGLTAQDCELIAQAKAVLTELVTPKPEPPKGE
jgi:hypothetical protein